MDFILETLKKNIGNIITIETSKGIYKGKLIYADEILTELLPSGIDIKDKENYDIIYTEEIFDIS